MVLITGIAVTAAGAIVIWRKIQSGDFGNPESVVKSIRQTTGVVLAVANFLRAALEALQLLSRPAASAVSGSGMSRLIGARSGDME